LTQFAAKKSQMTGGGRGRHLLSSPQSRFHVEMKNSARQIGCLIGLAAGVSATKGIQADALSGSPANTPALTAVSADANAPVSGARSPNEDQLHFHGMPSAENKELAQQPASLWQRNTLFDDYWGWRGVMERRGLVFVPVYIADVMGNPSGGQKQGTVYDSSLNLPLTVHLEKLVPGWDGATLFGNVLWIAGRSLSADYVGDISGTSNIAGDDTVRLQELWYQQSFWESRASVRAGLLDADGNFFTSDAASLFVNGTFGAFTHVGANLPNPPFYPMASPAVRLYIEPAPQFYFQTGVFKGNSGTQEENRNGLNYHFNGDDGALVFSEVGCRVNRATDDTGLAGTYKLGSFVDTANFHNLATGDSEGPDYGIYAVVDQELYRSDSRKVWFFARGGVAPADINTVAWYLDGGFNFSGFIPGRPDDTIGIAAARSWISSDYQGTASSGSTPPFSAETVIEATWRIRILPWWTLQPDFQYILNPGGGQHSPDATVIGLRTTVVF
jgi:porin